MELTARFDVQRVDNGSDGRYVLKAFTDTRMRQLVVNGPSCLLNAKHTEV
jgi:hypothetical protein